MNLDQALDRRMTLRVVAWPILVEHALRMSLMAADTLMLSLYSDEAVAAVGLAGNFSFFLILLYSIVSMGSGILIGQNLGAQKHADSKSLSQTGLTLSAIFGVVVGAVMFLSATPIVRLYDLEPAVEQLAIQYTMLTGGLSIGLSLSIFLSAVLRAYGHSKAPMWIHLLGGLLNVAGNYIALFGLFSIPVTGVPGVAIATVVSQLVTAAVSFLVIRKLNVPVFDRTLLRFDGHRTRQILRIGLPKAGEGVSYNLAQIVIMFFVAQLGTAALAAVVIAFTLARFVFVISLSLGQASQILSSYLVGKKLIAPLKRNVHIYWVVGVASSLLIATLMAAAGDWLAALFTDDAETQGLIVSLLFVLIVLEPGRAINLIVIMSLQGAGDVIFPVKVGIVSMWAVGVLGAYLLGIHWAFGVVGIWLAVALDEWVRGLIMIHRWQTERWVAYGLNE